MPSAVGSTQELANRFMLSVFKKICLMLKNMSYAQKYVLCSKICLMLKNMSYAQKYVLCSSAASCSRCLKNKNVIADRLSGEAKSFASNGFRIQCFLPLA